MNRDVECDSLLLDYDQGVPAASVGQPICTVEDGDVFWRGSGGVGSGEVYEVDVEGEEEDVEIFGMGEGEKESDYEEEEEFRKIRDRIF